MVLREHVDDVARFDFVASPLSRTRETMEIIRPELSLKPGGYRLDQRLREISFGDFEGGTWGDAEAERPEETAHRNADPWRNAPPGGESYEMLSRRDADWLQTVEQDTVCVAHGGVSRVLRGLVLDLDPAEIVELDVPQDKVLKIERNTIEWL